MNRRAASVSSVSFARDDAIVRASSGETTNPSRASRIAGAMTCARVSLPHFVCASSTPATIPGTPAARPCNRTVPESDRPHSIDAPDLG